ncbi:MAG: hypothetical protein WDM71_07380 [Ferruginibacter sp.]
MKKILITLLVFSTITFSAVAQENIPSQDMAGQHQWHHQHMMDWKTLNLSQDQIAQIKAYNKTYRGQLQQLNKNESITVKEYRDQLYALHNEHKAKIKSILTEDQKTKLLGLRNEHMEQHDSIVAKRLDKIKIKLGLSDEQVAQIKAQREAIHEKIVSVRDNDSLTREQKREQLLSIKNESKENFKKILTPDQLNKLEQLRKAKMDKASS